MMWPEPVFIDATPKQCVPVELSYDLFNIGEGQMTAIWVDCMQERFLRASSDILI